MAVVTLREYGLVLTGRPYGSQTFEALLKKYSGNSRVEFDMSGIAAMGSSFGEEVLVPFARKQGNRLVIHFASEPVKNCIDLIAKDFDLDVEFR
jgi:hypothetical protein